MRQVLILLGLLLALLAASVWTGLAAVAFAPGGEAWSGAVFAAAALVPSGLVAALVLRFWKRPLARRGPAALLAAGLVQLGLGIGLTSQLTGGPWAVLMAHGPVLKAFLGEPDPNGEARVDALPLTALEEAVLAESEPVVSYGAVWTLDPWTVEAVAIRSAVSAVPEGPEAVTCPHERRQLPGGLVEVACEHQGARTGQLWHWDATGQLRAVGAQTEGERHGRWMELDADGKVVRDGFYLEGQQDGLWILDHNGGVHWELWSAGERLYRAPNAAGAEPSHPVAPALDPLLCPDESVVQGPAGAEQCVLAAKPSVQHGPSRWVGEGNHLRESSVYADGRRHGEHLTFHGPWNLDDPRQWCTPRCPRQSQVRYEAGAKQGQELAWHPNGQKKSSRFWASDALCGPEEHWNEQGRLLRREEHPPCL